MNRSALKKIQKQRYDERDKARQNRVNYIVNRSIYRNVLKTVETSDRTHYFHLFPADRDIFYDDNLDEILAAVSEQFPDSDVATVEFVPGKEPYMYRAVRLHRCVNGVVMGDDNNLVDTSVCYMIEPERYKAFYLLVNWC